VMGLGAQMISWEESFCERLAAEGFYVIRYDNRDTGLSSKVPGPVPDLGAILGGDAATVSYFIEDMADDAAGLLDALGIPVAHIVGASMGGMIVQAVAIHHPDKVLSLCSIMSTPNFRGVGQATPEAMAALNQLPPETRDEAIERSISTQKVIGSPAYPPDEDRLRERAGRAYDRAFYPEGVARQVAAIMASPDRATGLGSVHVPTLVIHGGADPLVTPPGGEATAAAVPGAELLVIPGMGHELPEAVWPTVVSAIAANATKA